MGRRRPVEPLTSEDIARIEARHGDRIQDPCGFPWPCDTVRLLRQYQTARATIELMELRAAADVRVIEEYHRGQS